MPMVQSHNQLNRNQIHHLLMDFKIPTFQMTMLLCLDYKIKKKNQLIYFINNNIK